MESHANHCMSVNTIYQCTKKVNTPYRIIMRIVMVVIENTAVACAIIGLHNGTVKPPPPISRFPHLESLFPD